MDTGKPTGVRLFNNGVVLSIFNNYVLRQDTTSLRYVMTQQVIRL